ncbi:succinyl- :3-ketoacid-coenzyme a transferase [Fusarium oxysporum f. sp. phaseoli]
MIKITRYLSDVVCDSTTTAINKIWPDANQAIAKVKSGDSILVGGFGFSGVPAMLINSIRDRKDLGEFAGVSNNAGYLALDLVSTMGCSSMLLNGLRYSSHTYFHPGQLLETGQIRKMIASYVGRINSLRAYISLENFSSS